jgi:hypothetical protein
VCFQMRRIDHQLVCLAALRRKGGENLVEHPEPAPSDETIIAKSNSPSLENFLQCRVVSVTNILCPRICSDGAYSSISC